MEFMLIPGAEGRGQRILFSTDVAEMHVGTALDQQSHPFPCLTVHYADERQLQLIWEIIDEAKKAQIKPQVYLNRLPRHADIVFAFQFQLHGQFSALVRKILPPAYGRFLGDDDPGVEVVLMGAAEFDYQTGATGMGLNEFLKFHRETGFFLLGFCDMDDPNRSPHPPEFKIEALVPGHPVLA